MTSLTKRNLIPCVLAGLGFSVFLATFSSAALVVTDAGSLKFAATGPAGLTIEGDGGEVTLDETPTSLTLKTSMLKLTTGIGLRDEHLKKYIGAASYPGATLTLDKNTLPLPEDGRSASGTAQADLTFHGKTRPISVTYKLEKTGSVLKVQGRFEFDLPDFDVEVPCYLGVCVDKHIQVKAKLYIAEK